MLTTTLCLVLSAAGLVVAVRTAYRRRFLRAARIAALSLLPVGLALAGLVTLARRIATAFGDWAADLVFKPTVWLGFMIIAAAALLYAITRFIGNRQEGGRESAPAARAGSGAGPDPVSAPAPAPAVTAKRRGGGDSGLSDFADVEEILKRRGI